jgi:small subunit ribosomal protein S1
MSDFETVNPDTVTDKSEEAGDAAGQPKPQTSEQTGEALTIDTLKIGQHLVGTVKNITEFGAFVDVGIPQDGLVHISKLAKRKVDKVTDVVSQGQQVDVWVKNVDKQRGRLSLTMIRPIMRRLRDIEEDAEIEGTVTRLEPYGAFIDIGTEREGLVHISQLSHEYIKHPEEAFAIGDEVTVKVLKVDRKKRQVDLSIKALLPPPQPEAEEMKEEAKPAQVVHEAVEEEVIEEPTMTAMALALQGKHQAKGAKKAAGKDKRHDNRELDKIISRTLAGRE